MPPQSVRPGVQLTAHAPLAQTSPAPQVRPQVPQFRRSLSRSRQVPLQSVRPLPQLV
jgi:hypothetical protein